MPDCWALWHWRCPHVDDFTGELPPVLGRAITHHWFDPCDLLATDARSELRQEFRERQRGGGWQMAEDPRRVRLAAEAVSCTDLEACSFGRLRLGPWPPRDSCRRATAADEAVRSCRRKSVAWRPDPIRKNAAHLHASASSP